MDPRLHVPDVLKRSLLFKATEFEEEKTISRLEEERSPVVSKLISAREALQMELREFAIAYHRVNNPQVVHLDDLPSRSLMNIDLTLFSHINETNENISASTIQDDDIADDSETDYSFKKIEPNFASFMIWVISHDTLEQLSYVNFNNVFYSGSCYLIYVATEIGGKASPDMIPRKIKKKSMQIHIHYWIGQDSSKSDSKLIAMKAIELSNYLKNTASIHRESQLNETPLFKAYFRNKALRILLGKYVSIGSTAFHYRPSLYRLFGHATTTMCQLHEVSWKNFNSSEVFFIHTENNLLFVWFGSSSTMLERYRGIQMANMFEDLGEEVIICFVDDGREQSLDHNEKKMFNRILPLDEREVAPFKDIENDFIADRINTPPIKLYTCERTGSDFSSYKFVEGAKAPLDYSILNRKNVYLIDEAPKRIWMWCGSNVFWDERDNIIRNARGYIKKKQYNDTMPVTVVHQNYECDQFKLLFQIWGKLTEDGGLSNLSVINSETLFERPFIAAELQLIDSGNGQSKIYRVHDGELIDKNKKTENLFFSNSVYLIFYFYKTDEEHCIIYLWKGNDSSIEDQNMGDKYMQEKDEELNLGCVLVKMHQGYEPPHFLQIFQGKFTIFINYYKEFELLRFDTPKPRKYLLEVTGTNSYSAKGVQIPIDASLLNSNNCFILRSTQFFIWCGRYSTGDEREVAKNFAPTEFILVFEGLEPNEFWEEFGDRKLYNQFQKLQKEKTISIPTLYYCYRVNTTVLCEPIVVFNQAYFSSFNIILLDFITVLYVWIGENISRHDQKYIDKICEEYMKNDNKGRNSKICVVIIKQRYEPLIFRGFFEEWDHTFWDTHATYITLRQELENTQERLSNRKINTPDIEDEFNLYPKFPLKALLGSAENIPPIVHLNEKEMYLTVDDFFATFGMLYSEFALLPKWKQEILKKLKGLF